MDSFRGKVKKNRFRKKQAPPLFNNDAPAFNPMDAMPNMPMFSGDCGAQSQPQMNSYEIFDRFNQLFDWGLPLGRHNSGNIDVGIPDRYQVDTDDRIIASVHEQGPSNRSSNQLGKRRPVDANDLRNRLDQHNKRWKDIDEREVCSSRDIAVRRPDQFETNRLGNRRDIDDRIEPWEKSGRAMDRWLEPCNSQQYRGNVRREELQDNDDRWIGGLIRNDDGVWENPNGCSLGYPERVLQRDGNDRNFTIDPWHDNTQDFGRQVKEYWPDRNPTDLQHLHQDDGTTLTSMEGRVDRDFFIGRRDNYQPPADNANDFYAQQRGREENFAGDQRRWDIDTFNGRPYDNRAQLFDERFQDNSRENFMQSYANQRNPLFNDGEHLMPSANPDDLTVLILKTNDRRFTFEEADTLRSKLIDLVMEHGSTEQMPEFIQSGIMRNGRGFYVTCRTGETMNWLLQQSLPPLDGQQLVVKRSRAYETIKISAFASRCTRKREEILKLLKLQNGRKGFNFDYWTLRSYQTSPSGIYISFDISLDEARLLQELQFQLSFELKTLIFKISGNPTQKSW